MANTTDGRTLGDVIRDARVDDADLSLRDLAKRLSVTASYLSDIENNRRVPSEEVLAAISRELHLDYDDLMARAGRFGEVADRYLRQEPRVGVLFRKLSEKRPSSKALDELVQQVDRMPDKNRGR